MKPLVVYGQSSSAYMDGYRDLGDKVGLFAVEQEGEIPEANACYLRVSETLRRKIWYYAARIEKRLRSRGVKILNPTATRFAAIRKDEAYLHLAAAGIRVPWRIAMPTNNEIGVAVEVGLIQYPMILRAVDGLNGLQTRLILGEKDLHRSFAEWDKARDRYMICEYIETKDAKGYRSKWRPYIFGGRVDMWEAGIAKHWKVNLADNLDFDPADFAEANEMRNWPRKWDETVLRAAKVLGLDIAAFDVIDAGDGSPCIVDINETYGCTADRIEQGKGIRLFSEEIREIRAGHFRRQVEWMAGL